MKRKKRICYHVLAGCLLFAFICTLLQLPSVSYAAGSNNSAYAQQIADLTNAIRAEVGVEPLSHLTKLSDAAAYVRAQEISILFDHNRPDGRKCFTAIQEAGIGYGAAAENIAAGTLYTTPADVVKAWRNSSGHYANMINAAYNHIGVGYYYAKDTHYQFHWTQFFIGGCTIKKISLSSTIASPLPVKTGSSLDSLGLYLNVTCSESSHGNSVLKVTDNLCSGYSPNQTGLQTVKVTYKGCTTSFQVYVSASGKETGNGGGGSETVAPTTPATTQAPTTPAKPEPTKPVEAPKLVSIRLEYIGGTKYAGDVLTSADFRVYANYSDKTSAAVGGWSGTGFGTVLKAGNNTVTVSYQGLSSSMTITAEAIQPVALSISYVGQNAFEENDFRLTDFEVTVTYNNGIIQTVTDGYQLTLMSVKENTSKDQGLATFKATYNGFSAVLDVSVPMSRINETADSSEEETEEVPVETVEDTVTPEGTEEETETNETDETDVTTEEEITSQQETTRADDGTEEMDEPASSEADIMSLGSLEELSIETPSDGKISSEEDGLRPWQIGLIVLGITNIISIFAILFLLYKRKKEKEPE